MLKSCGRRRQHASVFILISAADPPPLPLPQPRRATTTTAPPVTERDETPPPQHQGLNEEQGPVVRPQTAAKKINALRSRKDSTTPPLLPTGYSESAIITGRRTWRPPARPQKRSPAFNLFTTATGARHHSNRRVPTTTSSLPTTKTAHAKHQDLRSAAFVGALMIRPSKMTRTRRYTGDLAIRCG